jgi:hypothetical protein
MAEDLAKSAYRVEVRNPDDVQFFTVGGDTPERCIEILRDFPGLITNPTFKVGKKLSDGEIEDSRIGPDKIKMTPTYR